MQHNFLGIVYLCIVIINQLRIAIWEVNFDLDMVQNKETFSEFCFVPNLFTNNTNLSLSSENVKWP